MAEDAFETEGGDERWKTVVLEVDCEQGEHVCKVSGYADEQWGMQSLRIETNKGKSVQAGFGENRDRAHNFAFREGKIVGFAGAFAESHVCALDPLYETKAEALQDELLHRRRLLCPYPLVYTRWLLGGERLADSDSSKRLSKPERCFSCRRAGVVACPHREENCTRACTACGAGLLREAGYFEAADRFEAGYFEALENPVKLCVECHERALPARLDPAAAAAREEHAAARQEVAEHYGHLDWGSFEKDQARREQAASELALRSGATCAELHMDGCDLNEELVHLPRGLERNRFALREIRVIDVSANVRPQGNAPANRALDRLLAVLATSDLRAGDAPKRLNISQNCLNPALGVHGKGLSAVAALLDANCAVTRLDMRSVCLVHHGDHALLTQLMEALSKNTTLKSIDLSGIIALKAYAG